MISSSPNESSTLVNFQPEILRFAGQFSTGINSFSPSALYPAGNVTLAEYRIWHLEIYGILKYNVLGG